MRLLSPKNQFSSDNMSYRRWIVALGSEYRNWNKRISKELKVQRRAQENGRDNLPSKDDVQLDVVQDQIMNRFTTGAEALKQVLWNQLRGALDLIIQRIPDLINPTVIAEDARLAVAMCRDRARDELIDLRAKERDRFRELQLFKSQNGLVRSADYTMPRPPLWSIFVMLVALFAETALNGWLFADASPGYLRDGFIQALSFSLVNVVLGFAALGLLAARYAGHRQNWKKALGITGITLTVSVGLLFNGFVAHYREIIQTTVSNEVNSISIAAYSSALSHLLENPFELGTWQALVLLILGLTIFGVLAVEGYRGFDDPYPGYGPKDREHKKALKTYEDAQRQLKAKVEAAIDKKNAEIDACIAKSALQLNEARDIAAEADQTQREVADSKAELGRACTDNLRVYREVNSFVRSDPVPAYYSSYPAFSVELQELNEISQRLEEVQSRHLQNLELGSSARKKLNALVDRELEGFGSYLNEIEIEAEKRAQEMQTRKDDEVTGYAEDE